MGSKTSKNDIVSPEASVTTNNAMLNVEMDMDENCGPVSHFFCYLTIAIVSLLFTILVTAIKLKQHRRKKKEAKKNLMDSLQRVLERFGNIEPPHPI